MVEDSRQVIALGVHFQPVLEQNFYPAYTNFHNPGNSSLLKKNTLPQIKPFMIKSVVP